MKCLLELFARVKKLKKGHVLKCRFEVVCEGQKIQKRIFVQSGKKCKKRRFLSCSSALLGLFVRAKLRCSS